MNVLDLSGLLNELPDDMIVSAYQRRLSPHAAEKPASSDRTVTEKRAEASVKHPFRWINAAALAACMLLTVGIGALKLRGQQEVPTTQSSQADPSETETVTAVPAETTVPVTPAVTADTATASAVTVSSPQTKTSAVSGIVPGQATAVTPDQTHASSETAQRDASSDHSEKKTVHQTTAAVSAGITSAATHTETTRAATGIPVKKTQTTAARTGTTAFETYTAASKTGTTVPASSTTVYLPPEPQTLTLPVWRDTWSPAFGYPDLIPPEEPQSSVNVFHAQFMQEVYHWSPAGIRIFDYDYLRIGVGGNAADAALLHAEYSDGKLLLTVGLQTTDTDLYLGREFLLPVPTEMHIFGRQCSVEFQYVEAEDGLGMEQPSEIEMEIH